MLNMFHLQLTKDLYQYALHKKLNNIYSNKIYIIAKWKPRHKTQKIQSNHQNNI